MSRVCLASQRQAIWPGGGLPRLAPGPIRGLSPSVSVIQHAARTARARRADVRCGADCGDPRRAGRQPFPWRRSSQGLGGADLKVPPA